MIGSSNNSGGVVAIGLLCAEQNVAGSNLDRFIATIFFHFSKFF